MNKVLLKELCTLEKGKQIDTSLLDDSNQYKYINGGTKESGFYSSYNTNGETVLVSEGGASCGFVNFINDPFWCGCHCYRLTNIKVKPLYLYYLLKGNQNNIMALRTGAAMPNIKKTTFSKLELKVDFDVVNQCNIINSLSNIEFAIENKKKQLESLDELIKSRFIEMFGTPGKNEKGWILGSISDVGRCVAGATPSTKIKEYWENGTIPWMSSGEVNKGRIFDTETKISELGYKNASTKLVPPHTVVLAMAGQGKTRGTVAITEIELCTNQSICSIVNNEKIDSEYLLMYLKMQYEELRNVSNGAEGRGGLNLKIIGKFPIMIPPIDHQIKFASIVKQVDKSKFVYHSKYFLWLILTFESSTIAYSSVVSIFECPKRC